MSAEGTWDLTISTPIGKINAVVVLDRANGALTGTAHGAGETITLTDVTTDGNNVSWKQAITKPLRLNLAFTMLIDGDTMTGTSKAGRLPTSTVTAHRRTPHPNDVQ